MRLLPALLLAAPLMALAVLPVQAQSDIRPLIDRLDRMERDMMTLQRQVYRGGGSSSSSSSQAAPPVAGDSSDAIVSIQERLERLEGEMRRLTGKFEELGHTQFQTNQRLERMNKDNDLRFKELEQKLAAQPVSEGPQAGPVPQHNPPPELMQNPSPKPGEEPIVLKPPAGAEAGKSGTLQASSAAKPPPPSGQASATPAGNTQEQYDKAYAALKGGNYAEAEKAFAAFVKANPNDALAGNAQYWLGESFYVRGDHQKAAETFAEGYLKYPKSAKASDNLLKLGLSLDALGKKKEACASYDRLLKEFKSAATADAAKRKATSEMQRLSCK
ncbi:MAG: tol-pal system protein YbgF [Rhodospirillales bacterium]|jgi:tol-pal system protein YbgF